MRKIIKNIGLYLMLVFCFVLLFGPGWIRAIFGDVTMDEIVFHMMVPLVGSDTTPYVISGLVRILLPALILAFVLLIILKYRYKYTIQLDIKVREKEFTVNTPRHLKIILCVVLLFFSLSYFINKLDLFEYAKNSLSKSTFIEENYIEPNNASIKFPEKKRNLIYIMLESMETSYASKSEGGILENNLIPNLTKIANENISFSNTRSLGGAYTNVGTTWTVGAMVSHFSGIPLKVGFDGNTYGNYTTFLPGITNLGDILEKEGYNQLFILGSDIRFGGRYNLMKQHGNYDIFDWTYAVENGYYKNEDYIWWGYTDSSLYKFAKEELTKLASKNEPFNLTMLTVDTHFEDGYVSETCTDLKYNNQYSNAISCADNMVYEFINWIKHQEFYENTTIVIVGDHLTMDVDFFENYKERENDRRVYNAYINSAVTAKNIKNREFSTMDLFPTTLASLGVIIEGDRLGLGTNLFSESETLIEKYGYEYVNNELSKKSKYYNNKFLYNIDK